MMQVQAYRRDWVRAGFTLIELLTVMAIISILVAILMPALSGARRESRATKCLANVREIGNATLMYARRNDDRFPVAGDCSNPGGCKFWNGHQYVGWNGTKQKPNGEYWYRPVNVDLGYEPSPANPKGGEIAQCPSDVGVIGETGVNKPLFDVLGSSYIVNPILTQGQYDIWRYRDNDIGESDILQPSRKVLVADHVGFGMTFDASWTGINPGWHDATRPSAVFGFVDSHAEYIKGKCRVFEWQWYPEASGPAFVQQLADKVTWNTYPECN
ncbi:MAG: type II secretion system protein [Phycisphaerales bacterium]|nr:type II secretion system protein [Phycisphaerales bacterium]MCB9857081.1 type II secretion system protein [Phycisphaerales bacterium]MCB9861792.1 type II secretion system protein [Phycisphaerales bacterium]